MLMHITISALPLATPYCIGFSLRSCHLPDLISLFQFTAMPLARLYRMSINLQRCHLSDYCIGFSLSAVPFARLYCTVFGLQPYHWSDFISLVSVGSSDACQSLFHWFQCAVLPLARFDLSRFSLQPAYICTEIYNSESYHVVWLCPLGP